MRTIAALALLLLPPLALLIVLLNGCPAPPADDDDTTIADDDDVTGDDDDSADDDDDTTPPPNGPPVANDDVLELSYLQFTDLDVLANDTDPNGDLLEILLVSQPQHGVTTLLGDGVVRYESLPGWSGPDTFQYTVADPGGLVDGASVDVTVSCIDGMRRLTTLADGTEAVEHSSDPTLTADGSELVFRNDGDFTTGDTNGYTDFHVTGTDTPDPVRLDITWDDGEPDGWSDEPRLSPSGRYLTFASSATTLVANDTNGTEDVFRLDRDTGDILRVSLTVDGFESTSTSYRPWVSDSGAVAFLSFAMLVPADTDLTSDIYVWDDTAGLRLASSDDAGVDGDMTSWSPALGAEGQLVVFSSWASNLVPGDTNGVADLFIKNLTTGTVERITDSWNGSPLNGNCENPVMSPDARFVAFQSEASNLVQGDVNGEKDIFVIDRQLGTMQLVSRSSGGAQANAVSDSPRISDDGRYVVFESNSDLLSDLDTNGLRDAYLHDRASGATVLLGMDCAGEVGAGSIIEVTITGDGSLIALDTMSALGQPPDTNGNRDIYVYANPLAD